MNVSDKVVIGHRRNIKPAHQAPPTTLKSRFSNAGRQVETDLVVERLSPLGLPTPLRYIRPARWSESVPTVYFSRTSKCNGTKVFGISTREAGYVFGRLKRFRCRDELSPTANRYDPSREDAEKRRIN